MHLFTAIRNRRYEGWNLAQRGAFLGQALINLVNELGDITPHTFCGIRELASNSLCLVYERRGSRHWCIIDRRLMDWE